MITTKKIEWGCGHHSFYDESERGERSEKEMTKWARARICPVCWREMVRKSRTRRHSNDESP